MYQPIPGITHAKLTEDLLGTEGEMTPRPDDYHPYVDQANSRDPTDGQDPLSFDDRDPRFPDPPSHRLDAELPGALLTGLYSWDVGLTKEGYIRGCMSNPGGSGIAGRSGE